jgi:DNA-binding HxlR family transcriptional regulator
MPRGMTSRTYGQYCGLARAAEVVGERWALLVIRDLLLGPKRFTDLRAGLPRIPSNILSARLKELEQRGVVERRLLPRPASAVVYELTPYGRELEPILHAFGGWGLKSLGEPHPDDIMNQDSLSLALQGAFQPTRARRQRAKYEVRVKETVVHAEVQDGALRVGFGPAEKADLTIETDLTIRALLSRQISAREALKRGKVRLRGNRALFERFVEIFELPGGPGRQTPP